ncbi:SDR family NAD(P)-dependent oxidoreductase [Piscinibacter sp.]|jgi:NAD(P)-dependent dehydrogenase (short-subunit alcohol dehydrogenase family)|uniref:SDR family NAD(P)-dependent oxidoreductase n=1 Tax=Piscinibacter sp. TaxID=1903157 RepID=UPI0011DB0A19|nr:MAG: SDR family NAD(P)-dependent oxidoreductase [Burkholderiaceae bacterium]
MSAPVVLVTGAAGALGTAVARRFERDGARVVPAGRDEVDITDAAAVAAFVARVLAEHGRIDALVHVAGGFEMGETVDAISRASWERMMDLNAWSFVALAAPVVAQMKRQGNGRIVAVSAAAAGAGQALKGAYIASKSALQRLVETLAAELAGSGIAVNSVAPTTLDTPANRAAMPDADPSAWVSLEAAADAIAFLATRAGAAVHGQHLKLGA